MRPSNFAHAALVLALAACGRAPEAFSLRFAALVDGAAVGCTDTLPGFGTSADNRIGINDLRFYVSNLKLLDKAGKPVEATLDADAFQYRSDEGWVGMIDLTGNTEGSCVESALGGSEGTARTHPAITGKTLVQDVASLSFEVGVPQPMMKKVIASNTPEGSPSPLNEMYWSWNSGYRHLVLNFTVRNANNVNGGGFVHVGSRDCSSMGSKALENRDTCGFVNNPAVSLGSFDLAKDKVGIDLRKLLQGIDFISPIYDSNFVVIGMGPGVECHSSPMQADCRTLFGSLGLDMATGSASAASNGVFVRVQ